MAEFHDIEVENTLTEHALTLDPGRLAKAAKRLAYLYDQDGQYTETAYREKHRSFDLHNRIDGSASVEGELTAECAEVLRVALAAYGQPAPAGDGERDPRTASQRRHDALLLGLKSAMNAGAWPKSGGVTSTLILTMSDEAYATGRGTATTGHGYVIPAQLAKQWLGCDFRAIAVVMTSTKEITAYSKIHRIFLENQRLAMWARDQNSDELAGTGLYYTEAHHITEYQDSKQTTVSDGALLIRWNHRHRFDRGWTMRMINGVPHWIPPPPDKPEEQPDEEE